MYLIYSRLSLISTGFLGSQTVAQRWQAIVSMLLRFSPVFQRINRFRPLSARYSSSLTYLLHEHCLVISWLLYSTARRSYGVKVSRFVKIEEGFTEEVTVRCGAVQVTWYTSFERFTALLVCYTLFNIGLVPLLVI